MDPSQSSRRPAYPALSTSSTSTSAFQNSTSSISSTSSASSQYQTIPVSPHQSAPLPSPNVAQGQFFASFEQQHLQAQLQAHLQAQQEAARQQYLAQQLAQQQQYLAQQQQAQMQQQQMGYGYQPDRGAAGATAQETNSYIDRYSRVAEAAKRAQMACLERDLNGVELG